jgi:hypothetical protein
LLSARVCLRASDSTPSDRTMSSSRRIVYPAAQNIIREMIQGLRHRVASLLARRTTRYNDALAALRHRWRALYKMAEVVPLNFLLYGVEQFGLEHGLSRWRGTGRQDRTIPRLR